VILLLARPVRLLCRVEALSIDQSFPIHLLFTNVENHDFSRLSENIMHFLVGEFLLCSSALT